MAGSILVFGGNKNQREERVVEIVNSEESKAFEKVKNLLDKPDIKVIDLIDREKSIGISQTREGTKFLQEKPFSYSKKFLIILSAEKLTTQAQNSLLKTLEEPPAYGVIILSSKTQSSLLETIVSRCRMIGVKKEGVCEVVENEKSLRSILSMSLGERMDVASEIGKEEKEDILNIMECWIEEGRDILLKDPRNEANLINIKRIVEIKNDLENTNVNVRLSLEALLLSLVKSFP